MPVSRRRGAVKEVSGENFGFLIAYVLPGFVSLWGVSHFSPTVRGWLITSASTASTSPTVGGFLYVTLASVAAGLTASTIRWALIDRLHEVTGIKRPRWDDSRLHERLGAFEALVENHYRYYQFYGNMLVALLFLFVARLVAAGRSIADINPLDCAILALGALYWAGSRDTLRKYFSRAELVLGTIEREVQDDKRPLQAGRDGKQAGREEGEPTDGEPGPDPQDG
jgi:hypothetical protein